MPSSRWINWINWIKMKGALLLLVLIVVFSSGCTENRAGAFSMTNTPAYPLTPTHSATSAPLATKTPLITLAPTQHTTPAPTSTEIPTISPTPSADSSSDKVITTSCPSIKGLMLHSSFGVKRTEELVAAIAGNGFIPTTYEDAYRNYYQEGTCPPSNLIVISIDDFGPYKVQIELQKMVEIFLDNAIPISIGVVAHDDTEEDTWEYYKYLQENGVEITSHTASHPNLTNLYHEEIRWELEASYSLICKKLGTCPISLALPYGLGANSSYILSQAEETGYKMVISIAGDTTISLDEYPIIFKRVSPSMDNQEETLDYLEKAFSQE